MTRKFILAFAVLALASTASAQKAGERAREAGKEVDMDMTKLHAPVKANAGQAADIGQTGAALKRDGLHESLKRHENTPLAKLAVSGSKTAKTIIKLGADEKIAGTDSYKNLVAAINDNVPLDKALEKEFGGKGVKSEKDFNEVCP